MKIFYNTGHRQHDPAFEGYTYGKSFYLRSKNPKEQKLYMPLSKKPPGLKSIRLLILVWNPFWRFTATNILIIFVLHTKTGNPFHPSPR